MSYFHKFFFRIIFKKELRSNGKFLLKDFLFPYFFFLFFFIETWFILSPFNSSSYLLELSSFSLPSFPSYNIIVSSYYIYFIPSSMTRFQNFSSQEIILTITSRPIPNFFNSSLPRHYKILSKSFIFTLSFTLIPSSFIAKKDFNRFLSIFFA